MSKNPLRRPGQRQRRGRRAWCCRSGRQARTPAVNRENEAVVGQFISEANNQKYDRIAELVITDYTRYDSDAGGDDEGPEPFIEALQHLHEAFPR